MAQPRTQAALPQHPLPLLGSGEDVLGTVPRQGGSVRRYTPEAGDTVAKPTHPSRGHAASIIAKHAPDLHRPHRRGYDIFSLPNMRH